MKAIQITETGGPDVLNYVDVQDPRPFAGQALVEIKAIGVNFIDVYMRTGLYPGRLPMVPGMEAAGVVLEVGEGVSEVSKGDAVAFASTLGSYAERIVVPEWTLVKVPDGLDLGIAAAVMLQGMTAHYLSRDTYSLGAGDVCLVHAAAGGVGLLLTQMAKNIGATVIGTVSTEEKAMLAKEAGVDHIINYVEQDFESEVKQITGGSGVDVVYDAVGVTTFDKSIACLKARGYMILYGQSSGPVPPVPPTVLAGRSLFLTRPTLASYSATKEEIDYRAGEVLHWLNTGELNLHIHDRYKLEDAKIAHEHLEGRLTTGKLLLIP